METPVLITMPFSIEVVTVTIGVLSFIGVVFLFWANHFSQPKIIATELKSLKARVEEFFTIHDGTAKKVCQLAEDVAYMRGLFQAPPKLVTVPVRKRKKQSAQKVVSKKKTTAKK